MPLDITRFIFTLISSLVFFCQPASADGSSELTVGIVPQQSATALAAAWIPMLSEAAKRAGVKLAFRTAGDIPTFEQRLKNGEYLPLHRLQQGARLPSLCPGEGSQAGRHCCRRQRQPVA